MSEPKIELPQLSLAHYFDLLKRRRWQVIPISLLGLLIGGIIAFFVPRYYVAETYVDYYRLPSDLESRPTEDPFKFVVDNATILIPQAVAATAKKLGWSESAIADPADRRQAEREIETRISVRDVNPGEGRSYARIVVAYRDRDGAKSAQFLNTLVATWMEQQVADMRRSIALQSQQANQRAIAALGEYNTINRDLTHLSVQHDFDRMWDQALQREEMRAHEESLAEQQERLDGIERDIASAQQKIAIAQRNLTATPRELDADATNLATRFPPDSQEGRWFAELRLRKQSREVMGDAHPYRASTDQRVAWLEAQLRNRLTGGNSSDNPRILELRNEIAGLESSLAGLQASRSSLQKALVDARAEQQRRADAAETYFSKQRALQEAQIVRDEARRKLDAALDLQQQLDSKPPVKQVAEAYVPKKPTEPNIFLVAGLGCLLGLGGAILLILVLDMLRGTFKTVDDAQRELPVPMLGGVSYLETDEQRIQTASGRRRASLLAGSILFGMVVVVTTYYVAPHRLPPFAREVLAIVLGG